MFSVLPGSILAPGFMYLLDDKQKKHKKPPFDGFLCLFDKSIKPMFWV